MDSFAVLIKGIRQGDPDAASLLVREYEPEIRRTVRVHLHGSPLRRQLDSMDICQSVLANFFVRAAAGQFDLKEPEKVIGMLVKMAHNKLIDKARAAKGKQRNPGGEQKGSAEVLQEIADPAPSPSRVLRGKELLAEIKKHLSPEEAVLLDYRVVGLEWAEIAARLDGEPKPKPDSLRKKFERAMDRVVAEMDVEELAA